MADTIPKIENDINNKSQPQLSEDEAYQLLKELRKEEMTLKQLIYEFTQELDKTKLEEQMLRNLIAKEPNQPSNTNPIQNGNHNNSNNSKQEQDDDEDIDINNNKNDKM
eukprot:414744_1